ncbi:MAG TPA: vWA domain-containing protein [Ktedonobacteraceae bacterium]|nr:vWA domain-containing protein [Ktedonobacteraceae bacterium]
MPCLRFMKTAWARRRIAMDKNILLRYLENRREALGKQEELVLVHKALCEAAPEFYRHLLNDPLAHISHKREVLNNLLSLQVERRHLLEMFQQLPLDETLAIVSVIQDLRINRSSARELVLESLLGHEQLPALAAIKRQRMAHMLRHVLGERTWSSIKRFLAHGTPEGERFLQREILRYAWQGDQARLRETLCFLGGVPFNVTLPDLEKTLAARQSIAQGQGLPAQTLSGLRGTYHPQASWARTRRLAAPVAVSIHMDGELTAAYRDILSGKQNTIDQSEKEAKAKLFRLLTPLHQSDSTELNDDVQRQEQNGSVATLTPESSEAKPVSGGRVALVLDLSQSMVSSGDRLYHPAALALALTSLLRTGLNETQLYQVGGAGEFETGSLPRPEGVADLAQALLKAARDDAQIVLLLTDGYENLRPGDVAQVVDGLRQSGYTAPIYQVVPVYAQAENLSLRRLSENVPLLPIGHEEQLGEILMYIMLATAEEQLTDENLRQLQMLLTVR